MCYGCLYDTINGVFVKSIQIKKKPNVVWFRKTGSSEKVLMVYLVYKFVFLALVLSNKSLGPKLLGKLLTVYALTQPWKPGYDSHLPIHC